MKRWVRRTLTVDPSGWKVHTELWPRTGTIEPDLRVTLEHSGGERSVIVVEVKWNAPLHQNQILDQWQQAFGSVERVSRWHVFIGKSTSQASSKEQWHAGLLAYTWLDFVDGLQTDKLTRGDALLKRWAMLVIAFLQASGVRNFQGFDQLVLKGDANGLREQQGQLFWEGWRGWKNLPAAPCSLVGDFRAPLFFDKGAVT